jgi:hypothetical protein
MVARAPDCHIDATRIAPGLYQGSAPPHGSAVRECGFTTLVLCAQEIQPGSVDFPGVTVVHAPNSDDGTRITQAQWQTAIQAAEIVARRVRGGERVLVTCAAGRNRSGLVSALALHLLTGISGAEAARLVKAQRHNALTNRWFMSALFRVPAARRMRQIEARAGRR